MLVSACADALTDVKQKYLVESQHRMYTCLKSHCFRPSREYNGSEASRLEQSRQLDCVGSQEATVSKSSRFQPQSSSLGPTVATGVR